ncbi:Bug family tripartite tricarboxylate transporter substrate binding protein [Schauerella aestuarii]|uniref:Bug family tripartite tricarboxylate transporter substrate binding protein n=1 Tax=Schauerella aestuarii TaxID=2511204 RepID=UPI00136FF8BE|nr:tripartite tricarboxylate transporter substrate binding protein [Achromobacter aestuarii]MYZ41900.1 tripartite tricarboxylate transporter substrate binding protein [Achromobacter aestuarii]
MPFLRSLVTACAVVAVGNTLSPPAAAESPFPSKPITLVVPFAVGGSADILARELAATVEKELKQPVVVDNRSGAGGMVGAGYVAKAAHDGYTLLLATDSLYAINPMLYGRQAEESMAALTPVVHLVEAPLVIVVNNESPATDFPSFLTWAKGSPVPLSYGTPGIGTDHHLLGELIANRANVALNHVPYRGAGAALGDIAGNQINALITLTSTAQPLLDSKKVKVIAVASSRPDPATPGGSIISQTLPGTDMVVSYSLMAPRGTPTQVIDMLNASFGAALRSPNVQNKLGSLGQSPTGGTVKEFAERMRTERAQREGVIRNANLTLTESGN